MRGVREATRSHAERHVVVRVAILGHDKEVRMKITIAISLMFFHRERRRKRHRPRR